MMITKKMPNIFTIALLILICAPFTAAAQQGGDVPQAWELYQNMTNASRTTLVVLQNLSPYDMVLKNGPEQLPDFIAGKECPRIAAVNGVPAQLPATDYGQGVISPAYATAFTWWDCKPDKQQAGAYQNLNLQYTLRKVTSSNGPGCSQPTATGDVQLNIDMLRCPPPLPPAEQGKMILSIINFAYDAGKGTDAAAEHGTAWIKSVAQTYKTGDSVRDATDRNRTGAYSQFKISAYTQAKKADGAMITPGCSKTAASDANVCTSSPSFCDPASDIVTMVVTLRSSRGAKAIPLTHITVMDMAHYKPAQVAAALTEAKAKETIENDENLQALYSALIRKGAADFQAAIRSAMTGNAWIREEDFNKALVSVCAGKPLAENEKKLIADLAALVK
ncbi:MAG: hypothetical protein WCH07_08385 [Deltaproteobacteria bacterium]